MATLFESYIEG